jgi:hypothetical protein
MQSLIESIKDDAKSNPIRDDAKSSPRLSDAKSSLMENKEKWALT